MEENINLLEPLVQRAEEYARTKYELFKLRTTDKMALATSKFVTHGLIVLILSVSVLIASIGAALWIGELLGKPYYGLFCIAGFYSVTGGVLYFFFYTTIKKRIADSVISNLLN